LTKLLIAYFLKSLASFMSMGKINITDICNQAGVNRRTFYYHFIDKQELICWIFDYDFSKLKDARENNTLLNVVVEY